MNPGNIRLSGVSYKGEVHPSTDREFKQFETMALGYRAMFVVLHTYRKRHALRTLREMIARYAPPSENNTGSYIASVCCWSGLAADHMPDLSDKSQMTALVAAMSRMENGVAAVMADVEAGWELYMKHRP